MRLDEWIASQYPVRSRSHAKDLIKRGKVIVDSEKIKKAGYTINTDQPPTIKITEDLYVGRGALKLLGALRHFKISLEDQTVLDIGASTGGFTDVCLQKGAQKVYALDVGTDQLDKELKKDSRVDDLSPVNITEYTPEKDVTFTLCDLSFVSAEYILPIITKKITSPLLFLFKPQFSGESKKGIINIHESKKRLEHITHWLEKNKDILTFKIQGTYPCPIKGKHGNQEFWLYLTPNS